VHLVGDVVGDVAVRLDQHFLAGLRDRGRGQALALQVEDDLVARRLDQAERVLFASPRRGSVLIWLSHSSMTWICRRRSPTAIRPWRRRRLSLADHQQAVLVARHEALDQHALANRRASAAIA
jgi:hypothetical protein